MVIALGVAALIFLVLVGTVIRYEARDRRLRDFAQSLVDSASRSRPAEHERSIGVRLLCILDGGPVTQSREEDSEATQTK